MVKYSAKSGYVILSGLLNTQAEDVIETYADEGFDLVAHTKLTEWSTLTLCKY
jgi:ribosomal protein L11 methyltransferase